MGLLDIGAKVLTTYKADVSDHKAAIKELTGLEKQLAKERLDGVEKHNKGLEDQIKGYAKVGVAIGVAAGAIALLKTGFDELSEHNDLVDAAGIANIDGLRKASHGLKTEMDLLRSAASMQNGAFKLTQAQMETTEGAMLALTRRGHDQEKVTRAVTAAVTSLKSDGLRDLGIFVDNAGLSMDTNAGRAEAFRRTMEALGKASHEVKDGQDSAADGVSKAGVTMSDAISKMKQSLGELVVAMAPLLMKLAEAVSLIAKIPENVIKEGKQIGGAINTLAGGQTGIVGWARGGGAGLDPNSDPSYIQYRRAGGTQPEAVFLALSQANSNAMVIRNQVAMSGAESVVGKFTGGWDGVAPLAKKRSGRAGSVAGKSDDPWANTYSSGVDNAIVDAFHALQRWAEERNSADLSSSMMGGIDTGGGPMGDISAALANFNGAGGELSKRTEDSYKSFQSGKAESFLSKHFGPIEEFDAYAVAFQTLTGAVGASLSAWIDGSMSAGQAFKKFIGEAVKGIAIQMAMEALKHGAYAIGSLAFGDVRGATQHAQAAGLFAAGAVAASVAAKSLSSGGGGAPATGGGGGGSRAPGYNPNAGKGDGYEGSHQIIVIGDTFSDNTPRQQANNFRRMANAALGGAGTSNE